MTMATGTLLVRVPLRSCLRSTCTSVTRFPSPRIQTANLAALSRYYASKSFPPHTVVSMPALSPTMQAGNIGAWQKKPGDNLAPGDVLVEIETDKAQMDFEFQEEGTLAKILKDTGEKDVAVGSPIAVLVEEGADVGPFESFTIEDAGGDKEPPKDAPKEEAAESSESPDTEGSGTAPPAKEGKESKDAKDGKKDESSTPSAKESDSAGGHLQTSLDRMPNIGPAAQKLALEKGVPIGQVKGSGPGGQITKSDIEKFKPSGGGAGAAAPGAQAAPTAPAAQAYEDVPASSMRKTIAKRLQESMNQNPHYFVASTISVTKLLKLRQALNGAAEGRYKLSVNDLLIKAIAIAGRKVPAANSSWREENGQTFIRQHNTVDVSVAVATPVGLMTPIIKGAHSLGLESISMQVKDLGKRARDGKLKPEEYQGGTITISNMGMNSAIDRFTAVINPPQACILAVGTTKKVAVAGPEGEDGVPSVEWDDQIVITGSFDHKVIDGAVGGEYMKELKKIIENPLELML